MKTILLIIFGLFALGAHAQTDSIQILVYVADAFTGAIIEDGEVEVLSADSSLICRGEWGYNVDNGVRTASLVDGKVPCDGEYLLRVSHKDYFTEYFPISVKTSKRSNGYFDPKGKIKMRKQPKERVLGEAVVKATKIKMVMSGDTIVYNADAFQLSEGSMLDALIEQLPGAELKDNGQITVNGKLVSSLLVNGKDFFRGDPKIALENLPAYMVNKVKVYEEQTDFEKMTGLKETIRPLVMDVNLKRQYSIGWIANAEAAYGTEQTYLGRIFALRFTDCSRLALFANINNTNDTRRPGQKGDWTPSYLPDGRQTSQTAGAEYYYENRQKTFEWTSNLQATRSKNHTLTDTNSESFLPSGNKAYTLERSDERNRATSVSTSHSFKVQKDARHTGSVNFYYDRNNYALHDLSGEFMSDPYGSITGSALDSLFQPGAETLRKIARNRRSRELRNHGENWSASMPYSLWWMPFRAKGLNDMIFFDLTGSYDKHTSRTFDNYKLEYLNNTSDLPTDNRNRYITRPSRHYNYNGRLAYFMDFGTTWITPTYRYSQDYRSGRSDLYRLDRLEGWGADTEHPLGTLPSSASDMQQALDIQNSEHSELWRRTHQADLRVEYRSKKKNRTIVVVNPAVRLELDHLLYDRSAGHYNLHRKKAFFSPSAYIAQSIAKGNYLTGGRLNYNLSHQQPDLVNTLEIVNDANPLYVQKGNAALRPATTHSLSFDLDTRRSNVQLYNLSLSYHRTRNALATERSYNTQTGGYTVRPVNVNGNWRSDGSLTLNRLFGKQRQFTWSSHTSYTFNHNVDMANVDGAAGNHLSTIRNLYLREQLTLGYSKNGWNLGAKVRGSYNRLTGKREDFTSISAWDYNYGLTARIPLPWGIGLSTDFTVFSRRGYDDPHLNSDDFVWNLRMERSVLHGNLTFALDGFDLLHDLSKVTRTVNAQGRTESYTNVLPSYFMAHVIYKFNRKPKSK